LAIAKSVAADVRDGSKWIGYVPPKFDGPNRDFAHVELDSTTRRRLVTETIKSADDALREMEAEQWQSVNTRLRMRRETMEKSSEAEIMVQVHEIEEQAARSVEQVVHQHCNDRINAELKVAALKTESISPAADASVTKSKLEVAESSLSQIKGECAIETNRIWEDAKTLIDSLLADAAARTNASLSVYESGEKRKIGDRAVASRNEILSELRSLHEAVNLESASAFSAFGMTTGTHTTETTDYGTGPVRLVKWQDESTDLESRIRQDVKCAVLKMARTEGVTVVFSRSSDRVPDRTRRFARLMSQRDWHGCGPVISVASTL
jgi:hypothetical protein